jgi:endoglucanase
MPDMLPLLNTLTSSAGLSGHESPVADLIEKAWEPLVDELALSRLGSVHGFKQGGGKEGRPSILLTCHMDAIGLIVTGIEEGFLHITAVGGIDPRVLPGQPVTVHATGGDRHKKLPGVIVMPPARLLPPKSERGAPDLQHMLVDLGLLPSRVTKLVRPGDLVAFATQALEMSPEIINGHSLDNRVSVAAVTLCLQELQGKSHAWDVWASATVQEETSYAGAATSAFQLLPDLAVAIDTTFAKGPGANGWETFELGKGITLGHGPNIHPFLYKRFKDLAERLEVPYATEYLPGSSGTEGMALQTTAEGIPTLVMSIPIRYMHTPVEMVALNDIRRAGRLLSEFILGLTRGVTDEIAWDD